MNSNTLIKDRSFYTGLLALTFPIVLQQLLRISVDTVNSIMLGSIDQLQMSAVSQANQVFFIYYTLCCGFSVGCCVLVAQYWGKGDVESIRTIMAVALRSVALFGLAASAVVMLFPTAFMRIYSSDPQLIALGAGYLRLVALMYAPCGVSVMLFAACRGVEQVKIVLATNIVSYSVNIGLDYCLLFGRFGFPKMGITGIAVGTVAARLVELVFCSVFVLRFEHRISFRLKDLARPSSGLGHDFIKVSTPIVAHEVIWALGTSASSIITGQLGTSVVAGFNVNVVLYDLCGSVGNGFNNACSVVIGKTIGSGRRDEVKRQAKTMLVMALGIGVALGLVTLAARTPFLSLYQLQPEARGYAYQFMGVMACIWPFSLLEMVGMIAILRAGGDGKTGFYTDIFAMWLTTIPLAALGAFVWGWPPALVLATIKTCIIIEAVVGIIRVLSMKWIRDLTRGGAGAE